MVQVPIHAVSIRELAPEAMNELDIRVPQLGGMGAQRKDQGLAGPFRDNFESHRRMQRQLLPRTAEAARDFIRLEVRSLPENDARRLQLLGAGR